MPDIIQQIRDTYATDKAAALNMLPELFKQYNDGKIINRDSTTVYEIRAVYCRICRGNHYTILEHQIGKDIFFSRESAEAEIRAEKQCEAAEKALKERET